jgi:uncharacterized protein (DUF2147 family)
MFKQRFIVTAAIIASLSLHAWAESSPAGVWKTIDDETGKPKSLVRITENNGEYQGKVVKLFRPADQDQNPKCVKCEDANKDQPIIGMTILTGLHKEDDEYAGGRILDPNNGKIYKSKMSLSDDGKKLKVRGYIGVPMLGRTQVWLREE